MPIPPSHCRRERQIKMGIDTASMSVSTVEPVVVRPLKDSKMESTRESSPLIKKGNEPAIPQMIQMAETVSIASRLENFVLLYLRHRKKSRAPVATISTLDIHSGKTPSSHGTSPS
jgi:hypothetical protein